jgi:hypothetical protein
MITYIIIAILACIALILFLFRNNLGGFFRFLVSKLFLINLVIAIALMVGMAYCSLSGLDETTNHGKAVETPYLIGTHVDELDSKLAGIDVSYIITDSAYSDVQAAGTVLSQHPNPKTNYDSVKPGRKLHLTIVKEMGEYKELPALSGGTLYGKRAGRIQLETRGFKVEYEIVQDENENVKSMEFNGKEVKGGTKLLKGSTIVLKVGSGTVGKPVNLPNVVGLTVESAKQKIGGAGLYFEANYEPLALNRTDSLSFVIKSQYPTPAGVQGGLVSSGATVTVIAVPAGSIPADTTGL